MVKFSLFALIALTTGVWKSVEARPDRDEDPCKECNCCRRLEASDISSHDCAGETYTLNLSIEDQLHLALFAEPDCGTSLRGTTQSDCEKCPVFRFDSVYANDGKTLDKVAHEFSTYEHSGDRLEVGSFPLEDITQAFEAARVDTDKEYSLFSHNCAGLPISMGHELGIHPASPRIVGFVARSLSTATIMEELSMHERGLAMIENNDAEEGIMKDFVESYIENHSN